MKWVLALKMGVLGCFVVIASLASTTRSEKAAAYNLPTAHDSPYTFQLLWTGVELGIVHAESRLREIALEQNADYWLDRLLELGDGEVAWQRYLAQPQAALAPNWLKLAADSGIPVAQYTFALEQNSPIAKQKWLTLAANANLPDAQVALADWFLLQQDNNQALPWLKKAAEFDAKSQTTLAKILWQQNQQADSIGFLKRAAEQGYEPAKARLDMLQATPLVGTDDSLTLFRHD